MGMQTGITGHELVRALKPLLQRLAALEKNSHPPVDLTPAIREELAAAFCASGHLHVAANDHGSADRDAAFLLETARYFEKRPTNGEDAAHWANVFNAENCRRIAERLASQPAPEVKCIHGLKYPCIQALSRGCYPADEAPSSGEGEPIADAIALALASPTAKGPGHG